MATPRVDAKEKETEGLGLTRHCYYGWKLARTLEEELFEERSQKLGWKKMCEDWRIAAEKAQQDPEFYKDYNESTMRAMQALMTKTVERAQTSEAEAIERCAKACEEQGAGVSHDAHYACHACAEAIRALAKVPS